MQPRRNHFTKISSVSFRRLRNVNSGLISSRRSFTGTLYAKAGPEGLQVRCLSIHWLMNTGIVSNRLRTFTTINSTPDEKLDGTRNHLESTMEGSDHSVLPTLDLTDTTSKSTTNLRSQRRQKTIPPQSMVPRSQYVQAIMQDVKVGELSDADVTSIVTETFERSKIQTANKTDITYAEQLVNRLVQEVDHRHLHQIDVNEKNIRYSKKIQTSHVIRSLGAMWHYVIMGSANLPVMGDRSQTTNNQRNSNSSKALIEQPFMTTGRLLMEMLRLHHMHPTVHPPPTGTLYNAWLHSCFKCSCVTDDAVYMAEAILRNLEGDLDVGKDATGGQNNDSRFDILPPPPSITNPTKGMYNHVLQIHAHRARTIYGAAVQAEDLLMRMSKVGVHPSTATFNRVLMAWSESPEKEGGNRAADLLHLMLTLSDGSSKIAHGHEIAPDEISFGTVISAFAKRGEPEACQLILEEAVAYFALDMQRSSQMVALNQCWNATLFGWAKSGRPDVPERIEALLNDGIVIHDQQYKLVPTKSTYVACIEAHLKSGRPDRVEKAESYLNVMIDAMRNAQKRKNPAVDAEDVVATTRDFDTLINAWFRSLGEFENIGIKKEAGIYPIGYTSTKASNLLFQMLKLEEEGYRTCTPSSGSFYMCIESLCRTAGACIMATKNVNKVLSKSIDKNESLQLSQEYKSSMKNYAKLAVDKALEILVMAENRKLSTDSTYATVIQLLCRIHDSHYVSIATKVLQRYEQKTDEWNLKWQDQKVWIYHHVVSALNTLGTLEAAESALAILRRIPKHGKRAIDKNRILVYTGVLHAFSKHDDERSSVVALELFQELISPPNNDPESNNSINLDFCERVLWVLANSNNKQSAGDACIVLNSIFALRSAKKISFEPSIACYTACIQALTLARTSQHTIYAAQLLKAIIREYESKAISNLPSRTAFDLVIRNCNEFESDEILQHAKDVTLLAEKYAPTRH